MIELRNVFKSYQKTNIVENLSIKIEKGEHVAFFAPSGQGKTTLLRMIAGLEKPDSGTILVEGKVSYLFQEPRLFPEFTVFENVMAPLSRKDKKEIARFFLAKVGLEQDFNKYPDELSGGMQQRAVLARALAYESDIVLLDEPFKGLDEESKIDLMAQISLNLQEKTVIFVSHDEEEVKALSEKIYFFGENMKILEERRKNV